MQTIQVKNKKTINSLYINIGFTYFSSLFIYLFIFYLIIYVIHLNSNLIQPLNAIDINI